MDKGRMANSKSRRPGRRAAIVVGVLAVIVLGGAAYRWTAEAPGPVGGTPRLVLDREVIDVGYVPFETPVHAVFTLTNAGDGALRLGEVSRVEVRAGC